MVEQKTENLCVGGSIPPLNKKRYKNKIIYKMTYFNIFIRIYIYILLLYFFGFDYSFCDNQDILLDSDNSDLHNSEDDRNFFQKNAVDICRVLTFVAIFCMVSGIYLVEHEPGGYFNPDGKT